MNNKAPSAVPPMGGRCCGSPQYDRLTTTGWALHFRPPTISIMSVLMYTEQPQWQGHGRGKHTCRKHTSDRIIKCHDWFCSLCARSVYCVGGLVPDCLTLPRRADICRLVVRAEIRVSDDSCVMISVMVVFCCVLSDVLIAYIYLEVPAHRIDPLLKTLLYIMSCFQV